jgi:transcription factor MYB, plant
LTLLDINVLCLFQLPGSTDNEIKNYWNTRKRRKRRCGSPLHPEYMLSQVTHKDMDCETPGESHGKKRSNECSKEKVADVQELVDELIVFEHLDYGKDIMFPTRPLKHHASTGSVQIPGDIGKTLNYVMTKNQSMPVGSAIGSGYPVYGGKLSTLGTIFSSIQTEIPSIQSSSYSISNDWVAQCPSACIEQWIPMECNIISQSNAYLMMHSSSAFCAPEHEGCSETQAPNLCSGKCA